jgi:FKBP-type peptidyl-prolyl cis-trans isomerase 2
MTLPKGTRLTFAYECRDDNGMMLESIPVDTPAEVALGNGDLLPALEDALANMRPGETRELVLGPEQAFGERDDELVGFVSSELLPDDPAPVLGDVLELQAEDEEEPMPALVTAIEEDGCVVDANHPMAGKTLHFRLHLAEVIG